MKHGQIAVRSWVWTISRGAAGRLHEQLDVRLLERICAGVSASEIADALAIAAAEADIDETRAW